jgi:hypothetical protein
MSVCASCHQPLIIQVDLSDDDDVDMGSSSSAAAAQSESVPDDVHLNCGCHFHWYAGPTRSLKRPHIATNPNMKPPSTQKKSADLCGTKRQCLLEAYNIAECPNCSRSLLSEIPTGGQQILCTLHNEGGVQENLDILPLLTEESYLKAYPEDRRARAFLEFCNQGDVQAIVDMLQDDEDEDDEEDDDEEMEQAAGREIDLLRYQDPIGDMQSGLHCAVSNGQTDVAWLLLYLASPLDLAEFPPQLLQVAEGMEISRNEEEVQSKPDIRSLRDADGKSAEDIAREKGGVWQDWIGRGRLAI